MVRSAQSILKIFAAIKHEPPINVKSTSIAFLPCYQKKDTLGRTHFQIVRPLLRMDMIIIWWAAARCLGLKMAGSSRGHQRTTVGRLHMPLCLFTFLSHN